MSDKPASELFDKYSDAVQKLQEVKSDIMKTWISPDPDAAYIFTIPTRRKK